MLKTNENKLVVQAVMGEISHPSKGPYLVSFDGKVKTLPGTGSITYNKRVGDLCVGLMADHVEPGVSIKNMSADTGCNTGLNILACCGNEATVITGKAKGAKGVVTGKHGGVEHIIVDFPLKTMDKLVIGDKMQIKACGTGLELTDFPAIKIMNISPELLKAISLKVIGKKLRVGVAHIIPAKIMGSGLGASDTHTGDYDIQLFDKKTVEEYNLQDLRFGDFVAIIDADSSYGRIYKTGAVTIGIIVHSDCYVSGHGPGVTTLFTSSEKGSIETFIDKKANIASVLRLK